MIFFRSLWIPAFPFHGRLGKQASSLLFHFIFFLPAIHKSSRCYFMIRRNSPLSSNLKHATNQQLLRYTMNFQYFFLLVSIAEFFNEIILINFYLFRFIFLFISNEISEKKVKLVISLSYFKN